MSARAFKLVPLALAVCLAAPLPAGVRTHEVRSGESVSSIAKRYYGNFDRAGLLQEFNDRPDSVIHVGEKLKIPFSEVHRVKSGDSWSKLAERYLDRASAYRSIALLNGLAADSPLQVGQTLLMPVAVPYELKRGETLAALAKRFYGDVDLAAALQSFNGIDDPLRLAVGQEVEIPRTDLRLEKSAAVVRTAQVTPKPVPEPQEKPEKKPEKKPEPPSKYKTEIERAQRAFRQGEFDRARTLVDELAKSVNVDGTRTERGDFLKLRTFVYVAFDLPQQACDSYRSLVKLQPEFSLNPQRVSPKIRGVLADCPQS